jgi:hypothetical protein
MAGKGGVHPIFLILLAAAMNGMTSFAGDVPSKAASVEDNHSKTEEQRETGKWDGFRGIRWGADLKSMNGFVAPNALMAEVGNYFRKDEKLTLGGLPLRDILWRFYKGKLYHVVITGEDGTFPALKAETERRYGNTYRDTSTEYREAYTWSGADSNGNKVTLEVSRDKEMGTVSCYFTYVPLEEQESSEGASKAVEDRKKTNAEAKEKALQDRKTDW